MSDYSFMKSGLGNSSESKPSLTAEDIENIEILLSLFITNAITTASTYVTHCGRNGVSKEDIQYALKYEVFEFLNRTTMLDDIKQATEDYNQYIESVEASSDEEDEDEDELNSIIIPDNEVDVFKRIDISLIDDDNKEFIDKIHKHYDNWDSWIPDTPLNIILKNAIDKTNI
jgi:hypothetical protein